MRKVVLDTSFILSCVEKKIDFFDQLELNGVKVIIPKQVISELNGLSKSNNSAKISLQIIKENKFKEIDLKSKKVDRAIINLANKNKDLIIASLDREIKENVENQKFIIRGAKKLEVV